MANDKNTIKSEEATGTATVENPVETIPAVAPKGNKVTSVVTIDFPSLNWGIHAGETLELPEDAAARETILSSPYITLTT